MNKKLLVTGLATIIVLFVFGAFVQKESLLALLPSSVPTAAATAASVHNAPIPTRTPDPRTPAPNDVVGPTVTPIPVKQTIDVDPAMPDREKMMIIIRKGNGDFIRIWASPERFQYDQLISQLGRLLPELGLSPSDEVFFSAPPAIMMGKRPPAPPSITPALTSTPKPLLLPTSKPLPSPSPAPLSVTTLFDDGRVELLECQVPKAGYHQWGMAEACFGRPLPKWTPEDRKRLGEPFHSYEHHSSSIDDSLRQYIGQDRYEARLVEVDQLDFHYTLFKNDQPIYNITGFLTTYDMNQSLQNVDGHIVWEFADIRHPTIIIDGQDRREALGAEALYAPYGIDDRLVFIQKRNGKYALVYDGEPIGPIFDDVTIGYCCDTAGYTVRPWGGTRYWFWARRGDAYSLMLLRKQDADSS